MTRRRTQSSLLRVLKPVAAVTALVASTWALANPAPASRAGIEYVPPRISFDALVDGAQAAAADVVGEVRHLGEYVATKRAGMTFPAVSRAGVEYVPPIVGTPADRVSEDGAVRADEFRRDAGVGLVTSRAGIEYVPVRYTWADIVQAVSGAATGAFGVTTERVSGTGLPATSRAGVEYVPPRVQPAGEPGSSVQLMDSRG
jgi:hypothetical protein